MRLKEIVEREGLLVKRKFKEEPEVRPYDTKMVIRRDVRDEVYDIEDAIADGFKLSLANMSMIYRLFLLTVQLYKDLNKETELRKVIPEELENSVNEIMDYYKNSETILDLKIKEEGLDFMKRIINRQKKIAEIVMNVTEPNAESK